MDSTLQPASDDACEMEVTIANREGLHARPAAQFVRVAAKYPKVELTVCKEDMTVNGKSIIGIMMLAAGPGTRLNIKAQGEGARNLLHDLQTLVDNRFGEEAYQ
ncbi:MAG TPA: HPr family phosphocarrier protein [Candidatus Sumerlaeota bacterium]|nr:HPr family phosphocarrier protein [Candidatus Sumerlaeota bacterium]